MIVATMLPMFTLAADHYPKCQAWTNKFLRVDRTLKTHLRTIRTTVDNQLKRPACYKQYFPASNLVYKIELFKCWYYQPCSENGKVGLTQQQQCDLNSYKKKLISFLDRCADKTSETKNIAKLAATRQSNLAQITEAFKNPEDSLVFNYPADLLHSVTVTQQQWDCEAEYFEWAKFLESGKTLSNKLKTIETTVRTQLDSPACYAQYFPASNLVSKIETFTHWYRDECAENKYVRLTKQQKDGLTSYQKLLILFLDNCKFVHSATKGTDKKMQRTNMDEICTLRPERCERIKRAFTNGNLFSDPVDLMRGLLDTKEQWAA